MSARGLARCVLAVAERGEPVFGFWSELAIEVEEDHAAEREISSNYTNMNFEASYWSV